MSNYIIRVKWPDITEEENARRIAAFRKEAVRLVLAADRARMEHRKKGGLK